MLTVPTTPMPTNQSLPDPGGWIEVCLPLAIYLRSAIQEGRSAAASGIIKANRFRPSRKQASKNP